MNLDDLTLVGHSLGAHIAGCAAKRLESNEKIGTIIGLDPASIGFDFDRLENRLTDTDANYVQIIHTDITKFGMPKPMGHGMDHYSYFCHFFFKLYVNEFKSFSTADIYPNGGKLQPGCKKRNIVTSWFGENIIYQFM